MRQLGGALGRLSERLTPDSLIPVLHQPGGSRKRCFDACPSYAEERGWQRPFDTTTCWS